MRKVVFQDELIDEDLSELDIKVIGKSIIVFSNSKSFEVL